MKKTILSILVVLSLVFMVGCSSDSTETGGDQETRIFTVDELSEYNGKDGNPAYVAVDGIVYDVSDVEAWANGEHGPLEAGNDWTDEIKNDSPHGITVLGDLPVVGELEQ